MSTLKVDTINEKSTNGNIAVIPTGSGKLVLDGLTWPHADGSAGQIIKSNGSAVLSFIDAPSAGFTLGTEQSTGSGTSFTFGSIPTGTTMIVIMFEGVSMNSANNMDITIGDAGGLETSGYRSNSINIEAGQSQSATNATSEFIVRSHNASMDTTGTMVLSLKDSSDYTWIETHVLLQDNTHVSFGGGRKSLSAELTQLQISGGTFDAGSINIMYM